MLITVHIHTVPVRHSALHGTPICFPEQREKGKGHHQSTQTTGFARFLQPVLFTQWFPNFSVHQDHLEDCENTNCGLPPRASD